MKKLAITIAAAMAVFVGTMPAANATMIPGGPHKTVRIEKADHKVKKVRLTYFEYLSDGRAYTEYNDGSVWVLRPCPYEDSGRCHWNAGTSGNHIGHSFVQNKHRTFYLDKQNPRIFP